MARKRKKKGRSERNLEGEKNERACENMKINVFRELEGHREKK